MTETLIERIHRERLIGMTRLADWWFEQFGTPTFDNGDSSQRGFMANVMALTMAHSTEPVVGDGARDKFREAFVRFAQPSEPDPETNRIYWPHSISTDYHPCAELRAAMEAADISPNRAPWKTHTHPDGGGLLVEVALGYGARRVPIYVAPVLDVLATMSDKEIDALVPDEELRYHLSLPYVVQKTVETFSTLAVRERENATHREFVIDVIGRLRAHVEATATVASNS